MSELTPSRRTFLSGAVTTTAAGLLTTGAPLSFAAGAGELSLDPPPTAQSPERALRRMLGNVDPSRMRASVRKLVSFGTRHTLSAQDDPDRGIGAARDWIFAEMSRYARHSEGRMTVEKQSYIQEPDERIPEPTRITNVVATLRGTTEPNRTYVVTGHYDSRVSDVMDATSDAPGADDDASGVALVMELARLMSWHSFPATIIFAPVAGEEQNLYGSDHLADVLQSQGADVQGMFTCDIVGSSTGEDGTRDPYTIRLFSEGVKSTETEEEAGIRQAVGGENDSPARQLARFAREVGENDATQMHIRSIWRRDRYLRGGDNISFLEHGWPAARFTEPLEDFRHQHQDVRVEDGVQYGDLIRFMDFGFLGRVTRVLGASMWSLAVAPSMPRNVLIDATELTNSTTLKWDAVDGAAGYEVVWRETTAAEWEHAVPVDGTTVTLDISKDNVFFGVRSVSAQGHHSPAVFPAPLF